MSGSTTELNLKTAVDADDTADYLTLSLADSLRTVDALFNNSSGHNHGGAHQGGPLSVSTGQIADGAVTTAKILDGTIQNADIADATINAGQKVAPGTITTALLAADAVTNTADTLLVLSFSLATVGAWTVTPLSLPFTTTGGDVLVWYTFTATHSGAAGSYFRVGGRVDAVSPGFAFQSCVNKVTNDFHNVSGLRLLAALPAGAHTFAVEWLNSSAGTVAFDGTTYASMVALEVKR